MADKPSDDDARDILYEWGKTQPGERLLGTYPNAFGDLRKLIAAKVTTTRQAAAQDAYERAATLLEADAEAINQKWYGEDWRGRSFLETRQGKVEAEGYYDSAAKIRALAAAEAEKGDVEK